MSDEDSAAKANKALKIIESHYKTGEFIKAKDAIKKFSIDFPKYDIYIMGPMIDTGCRLDDLPLVEEAMDIFENTPRKKIDSHFFYNAGNGYQIIYQKKMASGASIFACNDLIEKALGCFNQSIPNKPRALTNLGNLYDEIGRPIEALVKYEQALRLDPSFAMACGNKALAIRKLAPISNYETAYLIYAYQLYSEALGHMDSLIEAGGNHASDAFEKGKAHIESLFLNSGKSEFLAKDLTHPAPNFSKLSKLVKFYTAYCLEKDLYLNLHIHSASSDASVGDNIGIRLITKNDESYAQDKEYVNDTSFRLNEIKEAFIAARLALVQAQYVTDDFSNISEQTLIINNLDYSVSNIYVGYLKMAFKEGFSVLDKIAIFLNHYLQLGYPEDSRKLGYSSIWYKHLDKSQQIDERIEKHGASLYGIYSLFSEIRTSELDEIRNAVTHRYLRVFKEMNGPEKSYEFKELVEKTEELIFKVKCAIIYLHNFINANEAKKKRKLGSGFIPEMKLNTDQWLELWR